MTTIHTIRADFPCGLSSFEVEIEFGFKPARVKFRGGEFGELDLDPPEEHEIEFISARPHDDLIEISHSSAQDLLDCWAFEQLTGDLYSAAVERAQEDLS